MATISAREWEPPFIVSKMLAPPVVNATVISHYSFADSLWSSERHMQANELTPGIVPGDDQYGKEERIAEIGAAILATVGGISTDDTEKTRLPQFRTGPRQSWEQQPYDSRRCGCAKVVLATLSHPSHGNANEDRRVGAGQETGPARPRGAGPLFGDRRGIARAEAPATHEDTALYRFAIKLLA